MKNNITYYQHYVNADEHPKFKMLRVKYGWSGEGKFWALNNRIADSDNCELNLVKKYNKASIANDLDFSLDELDEFIGYLDNECDLIIRENGHITTSIVRENLQKVMKDRKRNKMYYDKRIIHDDSAMSTDSQHDENDIQCAENIQSKVKETKVKESKDNTEEISDEILIVDDNNLSEMQKKIKRLKLGKTKLFPEQYSKEPEFIAFIQNSIKWLLHYHDSSYVTAPESTETLLETFGAHDSIRKYYTHVWLHPDASVSGFRDMKKMTIYYEWLLKQRSDEAGCAWKYNMASRWIKFAFLCKSDLPSKNNFNLAQEWAKEQKARK